jgi:hypothetical protein
LKTLYAAVSSRGVKISRALGVTTTPTVSLRLRRTNSLSTVVDELWGTGSAKRKKSRTLLPHFVEPIYSLAFVMRRTGENHVGVPHRRELEILSVRATDVTLPVALSGRVLVSCATSMPEHSCGGQCQQRPYGNDADLPSAISARTAIMPSFLIRAYFLIFGWLLAISLRTGLSAVPP